MVFDTPFALDAKFTPQPQMVGDYDISPDQLYYSFTLRDGLKFHDGVPVRGTDCVVSLQRWMVRDAFGQSLAIAVDKIEAAGDKSFTIRLKGPFPLLLDALAKIAGPPFIMPDRLDGHLALQPSAPAFRQCQNAPGGIGCRRSSRFHGRLCRRPAELEALPVFLHLRHADGEHRWFGSADRQARFRQGQETDGR